jgi:hypothetical protein
VRFLSVATLLVACTHASPTVAPVGHRAATTPADTLDELSFLEGCWKEHAASTGHLSWSRTGNGWAGVYERRMRSGNSSRQRYAIEQLDGIWVVLVSSDGATETERAELSSREPERIAFGVVLVITSCSYSYSICL